jgi:hypothetical protein
MPAITATCLHCSKEFTSNRAWQKFCSAPCQQEHNRFSQQDIATLKAEVARLREELSTLKGLPL